jgi:hypothetical protein
MADEAAEAPVPALREGMVISVRVREDVVVVDPGRFLAAARQAYQAKNPSTTDEDVRRAVTNVYDAAYALIERYGSLASNHPEVAGSGSAATHISPRRPGITVDRPDGLSPAGGLSTIELDVATLHSQGCFLDLDQVFERP